VLVHQAQALALARREQLDDGLGGGRARRHQTTSKARAEDFVYFSEPFATPGAHLPGD
jgi:hypothetical protein